MNRDYEALSRVYDALTDDIDYKAWAGYYRSLLGVSTNSVESVLDIGCGTGNMSFALHELGFFVTATDIREEMLEIARDKAIAAGIDMTFARMDMRDMQLPGLYDAMVCVNDGLNYLRNEEELSGFFAGAFKWLVPGGALAFDISSKEKLKALDGQVFFDDREGITLLWYNTLKDDIVSMDITIFIETEDGRYTRRDECHHQRIWEKEDMIRGMEKAGFEEIGASSVSARYGEGRLHFAARKPGKLPL